MSALIRKILGPRAAPEFRQEHPREYRMPIWLFIGAAVLLIGSIFFPYWKDTMYAPQYPDGVTVTAYVNRLGGGVEEINLLNEYIGMKPLQEAAPLEKRISITMIVALGLLLVATVEVHSPWAAFLSIPAALFPFIFLVDLQYWLADFGLHLDPTAPLNLAVKPFIPHILGVGHIGQFSTMAWPQSGMILSLCASVAIVAGLWWQRRIFRSVRNRPKAQDAARRNDLAAERAAHQ